MTATARHGRTTRRPPGSRLVEIEVREVDLPEAEPKAHAQSGEQPDHIWSRAPTPIRSSVALIAT